MVNAWKIHVCISKFEKVKPMSQFDFRDSVTKSLLMTDQPLSDKDSSDIVDSSLAHFSTRQHFVGRIPDNKPKRCNVCHNETVFICVKCNISLHPRCFEKYTLHT